MKSLLGEVIGSHLASSNFEISVVLPRGATEGILRSMIESANKITKANGFTESFAVQIVSGNEPTMPPFVTKQSVIGYRRGERLFVWLEGDFSPPSSFENAVKPAIGFSFPDENHELFDLGDLAIKTRDLLMERYPDKMDPGTWGCLDEIFLKIFNFYKEGLKIFGNASDETWFSAWWNIINMFLNHLDDLLQRDQVSFHWKEVFAAASLPYPDNEQEYTRLNPKVYSTNIIENWFQAQDTALQAASRYQELGVGLKDLPWSNYSDYLLEKNHPIRALTSLGDKNFPEQIRAWVETSESQFMLMDDWINEKAPIEVYYNEMALPSWPPSNGSVYILPTRKALEDLDKSDPRFWVLNFLTIEFRVNLNDSIDPSNYSPQVRDFSFNIRGLDFLLNPESGIHVTRDQLVFKGTLSLKIKKKGSWPKPIHIKIEAISGDLVRDGLILHSLACMVVVPAIGQHTLLVSKAQTPQLKLHFPQGAKYELNDDQIAFINSDAEPIFEAKKEDYYDVASYDGIELGNPTGFKVGTKSADQHVPGKTSELLLEELFIKHDIYFEDELEVFSLNSDEDLLLRVSTDENVPRPWLPIAATAVCLPPRSDNPLIEMKKDLRGILEEIFSQSMDNVIATAQGSKISGGLFQCVIPVGGKYHSTWETNPIEKELTWLTPGVPEAKRIIEGAGKGPTEEFLNSTETTEFWDSLKPLAGKLLGGEPGKWICRCPLKDVESGMIDDYLEKFFNLVEKGKKVGNGNEFFAHYPFSVFLYNMDLTRVDTILLSPLHPLRLGWLHGAEQAVKDNAGSLFNPIIQILEGWNFPWVGPAVGFHEHGSVMVAVAADPGPEQLFLGWSCLARFDNTEGGPAQYPVSAGGRQVPGASGTGLNEGGVGAALWDFLRIYPHLPKLNIDLYSRKKRSRSVQIDKGILRELGEITSGNKKAGVTLPGGLAVFDSVQRDGPTPTRDDAMREFQDSSEEQVFRLSWEKYDDENGKPCDIRFVEDVSVNFSSMKKEGKPLGSIPRQPIRRFTPRERENDGRITIYTGIEPDQENGWKSFEKVLQIFESPDGSNRVLRIKFAPELLDSQGNAKWAVTGNLFLDPTALHEIIVQNENSMLWEWRPAYFPRGKKENKIARFERRPYTTIAEIPEYFKNDLKETLELNEGRVKKVINELGRRGIGLNSLFAMGGNHVLGALGFYFAYQLIPSVLEKSSFRAIVPIDPVDGFVKAAIGEEKSEETQRADIVILDVSISHSKDVKIEIIPVEVTSRDYKTHSPSPFPKVDDDSKNGPQDKLKQLKSTRTTFQKLVNEYNRQNTLIRTTLAVLLESGFLISNENYNPASIHSIYSAVNSGKADVQVGRGIMFWFQPTEDGNDGFKKDTDTDGSVCIFVDPRRGEYENILWG